MSTELTQFSKDSRLPPILDGHVTGQLRERVAQFYFSVAGVFESWVTRRYSPHTQRAYREDVMAFVKFLAIDWPKESWKLWAASIKDSPGLSRSASRQGSRAQNFESDNFLALEPLKVPGSGRRRVPLAHYGSQSGTRTFHCP